MPSFDRFDICEAYALYAQLYNNSGYATGRKVERPCERNNGDIWSRLSRLQYRGRRSAEWYEGLTENGQEIYDALIKRKGF